MSAFEFAQFFARKRANVQPILFDFGFSAHAKLGWRVWRAPRITYGVGEALGRVSAAFGDEIARCRRSKSRNCSRENARTCCEFCLNSEAVRMQNTVGACGVCCATRTVSAKLSGESALRLVMTLRDVGVRNCVFFREKTREHAANFVRIRGQCACKTRPARAACVAQHTRRRRSSQSNYGFRNRANFARKRANAAANFVRSRCDAHAKVGRRAPRSRGPAANTPPAHISRPCRSCRPASSCRRRCAGAARTSSS